MRLFEVECPDGRIVRHRQPDLETARKLVLPGYKVTAEVFGASADDKGGLVSPVGEGRSVMSVLLEAHGDEILAFLRGKGVACG